MHDLNELFGRFILHRRAAGVSAATVRWYTYWHRYFLDYLQNRKEAPRLEDLDAETIVQFLAELREREVRQTPHRRPCGRKMSPWTVNTAYRALRAFFNWAAQEGLIEKSPMGRISEPRVPESHPPTFTRKEIRALLEAAVIWGEKPFRVRKTLIVQLLFDTGIRLSQLAGLTLDDVILDEEVIRIRGKGARERLVPVGDVVSAGLLRYIHNVRPRVRSKALFISNKGVPLSGPPVYQVLKRLADAAGIKSRVYPHKFRHTFAREYLLNGGNLEALRRILGHTSVEMTSKYLDLLVDDLSAFHRVASPMDNLSRQLNNPHRQDRVSGLSRLEAAYLIHSRRWPGKAGRTVAVLNDGPRFMGEKEQV